MNRTRFPAPIAAINEAIADDDAETLNELGALHALSLSHGETGHIRKAAYAGKYAAFSALAEAFEPAWGTFDLFNYDVKWGKFWRAAVEGEAMPLSDFPEEQGHPLSWAISHNNRREALVMLQAATTPEETYPFYVNACYHDRGWFVEALIERNLLPGCRLILETASLNNSTECLSALLATRPSEEQLRYGLDTAGRGQKLEAAALLAEHMLARGIPPLIRAEWSAETRERIASITLQHALAERMEGVCAAAAQQLPSTGLDV